MRNITAAVKLTFLVLVFCPGLLSAQPGRQQRPLTERLESLKIAFITEKLQLSPEESQQFWPLYNQFEAEKDDLKTKVIREGAASPLDMDESEADQFLEDYLDLKQQELDLEREYIQKMKSVLPQQKIVLLIRAQRDFQKRILQILRNREGQGRGSLRNRRN
jgi:hypothetical protein